MKGCDQRRKLTSERYVIL